MDACSSVFLVLLFLFNWREGGSFKTAISSSLLSPVMSEDGAVEVPSWFEAIKTSPRATTLDLREWLDEEWRGKEGGWSGSDYMHSKIAACRIVDYCLLNPEDPSGLPSLRGLCHFTRRSESHKGFCHGGSICALMDDCIGWLGFCHTGEVQPWTGFTAQVNTSLKSPVPVGAVLSIEGTIDRIEGRKVWCTANLVDPVSGCLHGSAQGLFLKNK